MCRGTGSSEAPKKSKEKQTRQSQLVATLSIGGGLGSFFFFLQMFCLGRLDNPRDCLCLGRNRSAQLGNAGAAHELEHGHVGPGLASQPVAQLDGDE